MTQRQLADDGAIAGTLAVDKESDAKLLERYVTYRDETAFAALVARHGPMVFGVCRRLLRHVPDAEDAFQATFLILIRKAAAIGKRELLGNWLYGVAIRVAARARLNAAKRRTREAMDMERVAEASGASANATELSAAVAEEVQQLSAKYRDPVVLYYLQGRTQEEIAGAMRCPIATVKTRLSRAREMLRKRLTRRGLALSTAAFSAALLAQAPAASLPAVLIDSTLKAAKQFAAGDAAAGGFVSAQAAALTKGVLHTMFVNKLKMLVVSGLVAALLVGGVGAFAYHLRATEADAKKTDKENIQGAWKVDSAKANGREPEGDEADRIKNSDWTITADKITVTLKGEDRVSSYTIDPAAKPKTLDITSEKEGTFKGIYKLEVDTLTICANLNPADNDRPTEFESKEKGLTMLIVLKRVKK